MPEHIKNYINGAWVAPADKQADLYTRKDPGNGDVVTTFNLSGESDVNAAVAAAKAAFPAWRDTPQPKRGEILYAIADIAKKRKEELAQLMTREMGKPIAEARGDVQEAIDMAYYIASEGRRAWGWQIPSELPNKRMYTMRQPLGVCALITPWNFPVAIPSWKTYPALLMGNTVVFKPASETAQLGKKFTEIIAAAGVPEGVFNLVLGSGSKIGDQLVGHPDVRMISFTGSTETGLKIAEKAARHNKRVSLEMGGKNPIIVMDDADQDLALNATLWAAFGNSGQRCTACSRVIVHESIHDRFVEKLIRATRGLKVGHGSDPQNFLGAVINGQALKKIHEYVEIGVREGAKIGCGGAPLTSHNYQKGWFYPPTVLTDVKRFHRVAKEEIFGPVLSVLKAETFEDAIAIANDVDYGLSGSFFSKDVNLCHRASEMMEVGLCYINHGTTGAEVSTPFGGWKNTGNGHREGGPTVIEAFSDIKTVIADYSGKLQRAQIDNQPS